MTATSPYPPCAGFYDEALDPEGEPREAGGAGLALLGDDLAALLAQPEDYVAQPTIEISLHPTVIGGELVPRHVDLRPFVFLSGDRKAAVMPGGLTRVAFGEGAMVVNSTQNGGAKDTWVLP